MTYPMNGLWKISIALSALLHWAVLMAMPQSHTSTHAQPERRLVVTRLHLSSPTRPAVAKTPEVVPQTFPPKAIKAALAPSPTPSAKKSVAIPSNKKQEKREEVSALRQAISKPMAPSAASGKSELTPPPQPENSAKYSEISANSETANTPSLTQVEHAIAANQEAKNSELVFANPTKQQPRQQAEPHSNQVSRQKSEIEPKTRPEVGVELNGKWDVKPATLPTITKPNFRQTPRPPVYPRSAKRRGLTGRVLLRAQLNTQGSVEQLLMVASSGVDALDQAALRAAEQWQFLPYTRNGKAMAAWVEMPVVFELN